MQLTAGPIKAMANCPKPSLEASWLSGIGVSKESANGKEKHRAQLEVEIGGHHKACGFAHYDGGYANEKEGQAAQDSRGSAEAQADQRESREKACMRISTPIHRPSGMVQPRMSKL